MKTALFLRPHRVQWFAGLFAFAVLSAWAAAQPLSPGRGKGPVPATVPAASQPTADKNPVRAEDGDDLSVTHHSLTIDKKTLNYTATAGTMLLKNEADKPWGRFFFVAYELEQPKDFDPHARPITFVFNGGPGAAAVWLHLGALGPKRIELSAAGEPPTPPYHLVDNPQTWLGFTDLVFIDPVGTGFSRSLVNDEETKKAFWATKPDIEYLSRIVYDWLLKNGRLTSPKYIVGESYEIGRAHV
jgi:carboxypeptidase C (cathepsin A)